MQRYQRDRTRCERRAKLYGQLTAIFGDHPLAHIPPAGHFRKSRRAGGCGKSRCQICHPEKFPVRKLSRQEIKANYDFQQYEF